MTRTIAALIAAATIAGVAVPASAQTKYFAREKLNSLTTESNGNPSTTTYVPTYSTTFGPCVSNTKSKPMTSCSKSDGTPAALSDCSSFPQSKDATSCTQSSVCGSLYQGRQWNGGGTLEYIGRTQTFSDAESRCAVAASTRPSGVCLWNNSTNAPGTVGMYEIYYRPGATLQTGAPSTTYATQCVEK